MNRALNDDAPLAPSALDQTARQARTILAMRRRRRDHLPEALFGEPGWELLLQLYIAETERRRLSPDQCVALSAAPPSTASRWVGLLVAEKLIAEEEDAPGLLALTDRARDAVRAFLRQSAEMSAPPAWRRSASRAR